MVVMKNGSRELLPIGDPRRHLPCNHLIRGEEGFYDCGWRPSVWATEPTTGKYAGEYLRFCENCARKFEESRARIQVQRGNKKNIDLFDQPGILKVLVG
jgi:hypothetical protein